MSKKDPNPISRILPLGGARDISAPFEPAPLQNKDVETISRAQIKEALLAAPRIFDNGGSRVVRLTSDTVVKYGREVDIWEGRNLRYVAEHTTIPVPKLYDYWEEIPEATPDLIDDGSTICYIVMQYIEGSLSYDVYDESNELQKSTVNKQLSSYIAQLRHLKLDVPGPIGGGISNGGLFTSYGAGPFGSQEDLETFFNELLLVCQQFGRARKDQVDFTDKLGPLVFCHMDLHLQNMILDKKGKLWILDWACAGGYPEHFESASIMRRGNPKYFKSLLEGMEADKHHEDIDRLYNIGFALTTAQTLEAAKTPSPLAQAEKIPWPGFNTHP
ncbi:MAG: hypothetical protein M4579_002429 [Chaenotheca gracillima]|nr:MAG: hypothetical protein M4579_002429 [Chaenotheca gracillima]